MADDEDRDPLPLGQLHEGHGALLDLGDGAGRGGLVPGVHGLDGVHDEDIRGSLIHGGEDPVQVVFRVEPEVHVPHPQALGPELELPLGLLPGDIEDLGVFAQLIADLEHQGGLADPRRAADEDQGALDPAAPQDPVQLVQARGKADLPVDGQLRHPLWLPGGLHADGGLDSRPLFGLGGRGLLHDGVPGPTGRALALPLQGLVAAACAVKHGFRFHIRDSPSCVSPWVR